MIDARLDPTCALVRRRERNAVSDDPDSPVGILDQLDGPSRSVFRNHQYPLRGWCGPQGFTIVDCEHGSGSLPYELFRSIKTTAAGAGTAGGPVHSFCLERRLRTSGGIPLPRFPLLRIPAARTTAVRRVRVRLRRAFAYPIGCNGN